MSGRSPQRVEPKCVECGEVATDLVGGDVIYPHRRDLSHKRFWRCQCGAYVGCHPGTTIPLGYPAGKRTLAARSAARAAFDPLWRGQKMARSAAYVWLAERLGIEPQACHIGCMNATQARQVVAVCDQRPEPAHDR